MVVRTVVWLNYSKIAGVRTTGVIGGDEGDEDDEDDPDDRDGPEGR